MIRKRNEEKKTRKVKRRNERREGTKGEGRRKCMKEGEEK